MRMRRSIWGSLVDLLPHGYHLAEVDWRRRHRLLLYVLVVHVPGLALFGLVLQRPPDAVLVAVAVPAACLLLGWVLSRHRRLASVFVTGGLVYSSAALVALTGGTIEAHFHFFIIIGFIALYQDWVPFLFNVTFTVISHGVGSAWQQELIFNHPAAQGNPWLWSLIHGVAVLLACVGMALFWRITEDSQREKDELQQQLTRSEINRRQFTSDMLVNLARRNQSMLYRQLEIINELEESEQDPDTLAELFKLDHLATRVQRNAESLLVLSGEKPPRIWREPVPLRDVVRAAIAETEDFDRVSVQIDERPAISGHTVTDVTHLLAELTENAVRFSPPDTRVRISMRPDRGRPGGQLLTIGDWGVGMTAEDLATANLILAEAPDVDLTVAQRLGFHVVARLSARHGIRVSLSPTPGSGTTAVVALPVELFEQNPDRDAPSGSATRWTADRDHLVRRGAAPSAGNGRSPAAEPLVLARSDTGGVHRLRLEADDAVPGWWAEAELGTTDPVVPAQRSEPVQGADDGAAINLRRRVPMASLAPELRTPAPSGAGLPLGQPAGATEAIGRFHAGLPEALNRDGGQEGARPENVNPPAGPSAWFEPGVPATDPTQREP
jgi:signal transduction histidine kinase